MFLICFEFSVMLSRGLPPGGLSDRRHLRNKLYAKKVDHVVNSSLLHLYQPLTQTIFMTSRHSAY